MPDPGVSGGPGPSQGPLWFWSEEWGEMRHRDQVGPQGTYTNPITGKEIQGAPVGGQFAINIKRNTGRDIFSYVQPGPVDDPWRIITSTSTGREIDSRTAYGRGDPVPDRVTWSSGQSADIVGDFDLTRPGKDAELLPYKPEWFDPIDEPHLAPGYGEVDNPREGNEGAEAPPPTVDVLEAMRRHPSFRIKTGRA